MRLSIHGRSYEKLRFIVKYPNDSFFIRKLDIQFQKTYCYLLFINLFPSNKNEVAIYLINRRLDIRIPIHIFKIQLIKIALFLLSDISLIAIAD